MAKKKIGLALSGGGARGFAHVGVLKVFAEHKITFDMVAGTSAGSIIGGALAAGMSVDQIAAMAKETRYLNTMRPSLAFGGLLSSAPLATLLTKHFPVTRFEEMPLPFSCVAFDLGKNESVVLSEKGDLITSIRASCAVPGIFAPVKDVHGRRLVDGGVTSVMPVDTLRAMGADIVIAVDLLACGFTSLNESKLGAGIAVQSVLALLRALTKTEHKNADIVIEPPIAHLRQDQIGKREEFITLGEKAAREKINEIKNLLDTANN